MFPGVGSICPILPPSDSKKEGIPMRKLRAFVVAGSLAVGMTFATAAPAGAIVCIDTGVYCCGTVTIDGKQIQIIPITC